MKRFLVLVMMGLTLCLFCAAKADDVKLETNSTISSWTGGYEVDVTIKNTSEAKITSWKGSFIIPAGQSLGSIWSVGDSQSQSVSGGTQVTFSNPTWVGGGDLEPGAEVTMGMTISNTNGATPGINDLAVTGQSLAPPGPPQPGKGFPKQVFAPYVDVTAWPMFSLAESFKKSGQKYYTLAFIVADKDNEASWGGYYKALDGKYYYGDNINFIRSEGGDVIVSFGGANGIPLASAIKDPQELADTYQKVIDAYKLTWVDFDIEGTWVADSKSIANRNAALKILQANNPELKVAFCLPVLPSGLTPDGVNVLQNAKDHNVRIDCVNIMTMDFGDSAAPDPDGKMGQYCIDSAKSLFGQLQALYPDKPASEIWEMIGATPMIGQNDVPTEIMWQQDALKLTTFAKENNIKLIAMWSSNRDNGDKRDPWASPAHSGLEQENWEFTHIFQQFMR
ncbi:MAG: hypothetical protein GY750_08690 [Lentisphaerae bacterium]|nr:hypothetical protein [Lentisphaerota bacterium]MCP4101487.1 hypothetical protein [Lentisphaerota bacterium]